MHAFRDDAACRGWLHAGLARPADCQASLIMSKRVVALLIIVIVLMEADFVRTQQHRINGKTFLVPHYNLEGYQKFLLPKLDFKGTQHVYFNSDELNSLYQQHDLDPENLPCNLTYDPTQSPLTPLPSHDKQRSKVDLEEGAAQEGRPGEGVAKEEVKGPPRPALREKGFTHFVQIPLVEAVKETYQNIVRGSIDENDLDALVPLASLHVSLLAFRLGSEEELPRWKGVLESVRGKLRKVRLGLRGVGIFPVKANTNYTQVVYIKVDGLSDLIHEVVQKAIMEGLVAESELSHIVLDKKTDMYKLEQQHLTILKTRGKDIIDAGQYLRSMAKLNIPKPTFTDMRLSVIGSLTPDGYYDQFVVSAQK